MFLFSVFVFCKTKNGLFLPFCVCVCVRKAYIFPRLVGDNVNHFFDLCFCVCVVFVHLFEKVTTEKKQKIPTQICVCVVFLCCSAAFFSEQGYPTPLSRFFLGEGVLCVWAAFELCFWASVQQKNTFRCHPVTGYAFLHYLSSRIEHLILYL